VSLVSAHRPSRLNHTTRGRAPPSHRPAGQSLSVTCVWREGPVTHIPATYKVHWAVTLQALSLHSGGDMCVVSGTCLYSATPRRRRTSCSLCDSCFSLQWRRPCWQKNVIGFTVGFHFLVLNTNHIRAELPPLGVRQTVVFNPFSCATEDPTNGDKRHHFNHLD